MASTTIVEQILAGRESAVRVCFLKRPSDCRQTLSIATAGLIRYVRDVQNPIVAQAWAERSPDFPLLCEEGADMNAQIEHCLDVLNIPRPPHPFAFTQKSFA